MTTKKLKVAEKVDPTLPFTEIEIGGKTLKMCFDYEAMAIAETKLLAMGHEVNLNWCLPNLNFANTRILFAASLLTYQPDTDFEAAKMLVTRENVIPIVEMMLDAWNINMPEPEKKANPPKPE